MSGFSLGVCIIKIHIPDSHSLKDKRSVVKGLKAKLRNEFPISITEIGNTDLWQIAEFATAQVNGSAEIINKTFQNMISFIEIQPEIILTNYSIEML
jgi:uncharacterized protein